MSHLKKNTSDFNEPDAFDIFLKQKIQSAETGIPVELEECFMEKLNDISPEAPGKNNANLYYLGALAAAASILLAVLLLFPGVFEKSEIILAADDTIVFVDSASVEGMPANTYIVNQAPDTTIVWVEKIPVMAQSNDLSKDLTNDSIK
ncbi:MAG: hypothetical protein GY757_52020 [bacterium]|nr:hypothetical protein [bacterium]